MFKAYSLNLRISALFFLYLFYALLQTVTRLPKVSWIRQFNDYNFDLTLLSLNLFTIS